MTDNSLPHPDYEKYRGTRALLLTRVSSKGQSHEAQERVIREKLIQPLGLYLDEKKHVIHDTYTGLEYRYRLALDEILRMAERQEFDVLCLDVLDRGLGRKGVSREVFRGQLRELGIHILSTEASDHADDDSLEGQLMRLLKGYKAEEEINDFVRRSKNARRHKALGDEEKGVPPKIIGNGARIYGYKYVCDDKGKPISIEPNNDVLLKDRKGVEWTEARVIVFMFRCALYRIPMWRIAKRLNEIGIPSPSVSKGVKTKSKGIQAKKIIWLVAVLSRMLRNTTYSGRAIVNKYHTVKVPGLKTKRYVKNEPEDQIIVPVPALITEEIHEKVLKNLARNQKISTRNNQSGALSLLRGGLAKCGHCGRNIATQRRFKHSKVDLKDYPPVLVYRCNTHSAGRASYCKGCFINASDVDEEAWNKVIEIINNPSIIDEGMKKTKLGDPTVSRRKQINKELAKIGDERNDLQTTLLRMIRERSLDRNTEAVLTTRLKELERLESEFNSELLDDEDIHRKWEKAQEELIKMHKKCADIRDKLSDLTYIPEYKEMRDMIEYFGISATIWGNGNKRRFKINVNPPNIVLQLSSRG